VAPAEIGEEPSAFCDNVPYVGSEEMVYVKDPEEPDKSTADKVIGAAVP